MKICPDCRSPVYSLMFIDQNTSPEYHCERCAQAVKPSPRTVAVSSSVSAPRKPVLNGRR